MLANEAGVRYLSVFIGTSTTREHILPVQTVQLLLQFCAFFPLAYIYPIYPLFSSFFFSFSLHPILMLID